MSDTFDKTGYYLYSEYICDEDGLFDAISRIYSQLLRTGLMQVNMQEDKFANLSYSDLVDWNASHLADRELENHSPGAAIVMPHGFVLTYHDEGDRHAMGWCNTSNNASDYDSRFDVQGVTGFLHRITDMHTLIEVYPRLKVPLPSSEDLLEAMFDSEGECENADGDWIEYFDRDMIHMRLCEELAKSIVGQEIIVVFIAPAEGQTPVMWRYTDLDERRLKAHKENLEKDMKKRRGE